MAYIKMVRCEVGNHPVRLASHGPKPLHYACSPCAAGIEYVVKMPAGGLKTKRGKESR